ETNVAAVFSDDASHGVQAQPCSFSDWLGGEKRFEDARPCGCRYSRTVITNLNQNISWLPLGTYFQRSAFAHRIDSINNQVGPHLVELAAVGFDQRQRFSIVTRNANVLPFQLVLQD